MTKYARLLRPGQWVKNLFVLLPMFFGKQLFVAEDWLQAALAFVCFCLAASSVYCLNDAVDAPSDRLHPEKKSRPVASGKIPARNAVMMGTLLGVTGVALSCLIPSGWGVAIIAGYWIINIAYCLRLKQVPLLDVGIISLGFVFRLALGGVACGIWLSPWIVCMTFLLSLMLAFSKRRDDVLKRYSMSAGKKPTRRSAEGYNLEFLSSALSLIAGATLVCYIIFCLSPDTILRMGSEYVYFTAVFVLGGILRYLQLALVANSTGSPTKVLLHDRFIQGCILCWLVSFFIILY